ncbi:uncharacterized protein DEA37_0001573 [Paragonimus westermani]|uniref:Trematode PH-like domain-containing protein n=1 Tax=Paragonimus westermani TaxID=34504 RepID=A0A5J4NDG3_9TREM|nr:uncharacterized protein DEA37_0001573 [Paragonimus westermani]
MSGKSLTKSKSSSQSRLSSQSNGELRDNKTKQKIFYRCTVCSIARATRDSEDAKNGEAIGKLLSSQMKKRHTHGIQLSCLEDRLNFKKTKIISRTLFRNWVLYGDIEHYFIFPQHPQLFMLAIKSDVPGKSLFETYKCKTVEDTNKICETVCRACREPSKRLTDNGEDQRPISTISDLSIHSNAVSQPNLNMNDGECEQEDQDEHALSPTSPIELRENSPINLPVVEVRELSPIEVPMVKTVMHRSIPKTYAHGHDQSKDESSDEEYEKTTYFDYHPTRGATLNHEGPIFMYLRRFESTLYENHEVDCAG